MFSRSTRACGLALGAGAILAGLLPACQQGVVPGSAYDRPLWSFSGFVRPAGTIPETTTGADGGVHPTNPIMSLLWTDPLQRTQDIPQPARNIASTVSTADGTFHVDVYGPPPPQAMVEIPSPSGPSMRLALAEILMIDDQNHDGTFEVSGSGAAIGGGDRYLTGGNTVLVYLDRTYASLPPGNLLVVSGDQGYQLVGYVCDHQSVAQVLQQDAVGGTVEFTQPSTTFPDVRSCARTHSP
jgi:hypothetical protein